MDETTKQALGEFVEKMLKAAESGATWTAEQAPLVVQEWLRWKMAEAVVTASVLVVVFCVGIVAAVASWRNWSDWCADDDLLHIIATAAVAVAGIIAGANSVWWIMLALKVWLAPRVVILEKFADLVK